jgi:predicted lipoprotein with Yx(FWY)xxD motif
LSLLLRLSLPEAEEARAQGTRGTERPAPSPRRRLAALLGVGALAVILLAGCSSGGTSSSAAKTTTSTAPPTSTSTSTSGAAVTTPSGSAPVYQVSTGVVPGLGRVLVDGQGFTLYVFAPDKRSGTSTCYSACASAWPPLILPNGVSQAPAGPGVRAALLGTTKRNDGTVQVTYDKWPLYTFVIDSGPGTAAGQDLNNLGGFWYVITPAGTLIKHR